MNRLPRRRPARAIARGLPLLTLLLAGCAEIAPPPGGPLDMRGPALLAIEPESLAVGVAVDAPLRLTFSEKVDHESVRNWLTVTPYRRIDSFRWKGATVEILPRGGWPADTTISVLIGSGVIDRGLNPLGRPVRRTFATGGSVAPGVFAGTLRRTREPAPTAPPSSAGRGEFGASAPGAAARSSATGPLAYVWVYAVRADSVPDPARENPDYQTEVEASGEFRIDGVAPGAYRLFTINDGDRSRSFSPFRDYATRQPDSLIIAPTRAVYDTLRLILIDPKATGRISGRLAAIDTTVVPDTLAWGVILATQPATDDTLATRWPPTRASYQVRAEKSGGFALIGVAPGEWRIAAFLDLNRDGKWGRPEPLAAPLDVRLEPAGTTETPALDRPRPAGP